MSGQNPRNETFVGLKLLSPRLQENKHNIVPGLLPNNNTSRVTCNNLSGNICVFLLENILRNCPRILLDNLFFLAMLVVAEPKR